MREVQQPRADVSWMSTVSSSVDVYAFAPEYVAPPIKVRQLSTYEGAAIDNTRGGSWIGSRLSTDSALEADLTTLRNRSRELYRNDSFGGAVDDIVNHVVGVGFTPQCRISERIVGTEASQVFCEETESVYERWAPHSDISGRLSLWQQTRLLCRHICLDEGLAVLSDDPTTDKVIPLAVEIIDPERLETPIGMSGNKLIRMGVEKDEAGRIVAYWIRRAVPGDALDVDQRYDRVDASRVLHVFERWFAGQTRSLPWLTRALNRIKDCKDLDEAEIIAAQVQACFAVFVKQAANPAMVAAANASSASGNRRYEDIHPGTKEYLAAGEEVVFAQPTRPGGTFAPFQEWNYRRVAAALNWPYEMLIKNWTGLSFAAGRLVLAGCRLDVKSRQKLITEQFLTPVWQRVVDEAVMLGECSIEPRNWRARPWVYHKHTWTPPAWPYAINPGEEVKAKIEAVNNNHRTLAGVVAEEGEDLEEVLAQRQREMRMQRQMDILPPEVKQVDVAEVAAEASAATAGATNAA